MRTNRRRMPLTLNDRKSKAILKDDLSSENSVIVTKKSRLDASQCSEENVVISDCDAGKSGSVYETENSDLSDRRCSSNDDNHSSNGFDGNFVVSELDNLLNDQPQCHDSNVEEVSVNTSRAVDVSVKVEDCWWNKVDSHTWLQGLQSYLLLHSAVDTELCQIPVAVPNAAPFSVTANPASHHPCTLLGATTSAAAGTNGLFTEHQYARPVLVPATGYRVLPNGVLSAVPVYYFPVVNYSVCGPSLGRSAAGSQQTNIGGRPSTMAAVDLVSFMHNYCLPPSSIPQSSVNSAVVQTTHDAADQQFVSSQTALPNKGPGTVMITRAAAASDERLAPVVPEQMESSDSGSWPTTAQSSDPGMTGLLSSSSVCLTPKSLSSCSSGESWNDDALELTSGFSTVAEESIVNIKTCDLLSADSDLTVPGWFGKGLGIKRLKRRLSRQS